MKSILLLLGPLLIAGSCNQTDGKKAAPSSSRESGTPVVLPEKEEISVKPQDEDLKEIINNTDSIIEIERSQKLVIVYPPRKEEITISAVRTFGSPSAHIGFCEQIPYYIASVKRIQQIRPRLNDLQQNLEKFIEKKISLQERLKAGDLSLEEEKSLRKEFIMVQSDIEDTTRHIKRNEDFIERLEMTKNYEVFLYRGAMAAVKWEDKWEQNLLQLKEENKGWNFEKAPLPLKIKMSAPGLEILPASKMILNTGLIGISENVGGTYLIKYPRSFETLNLTLFGACPLFNSKKATLPDFAQEKGSFVIEVIYQ